MANEINQLFHDIISECKSKERLSQFSDSVRNRLEKYERNMRKEIVSRKKKNRAPLFYACETGKVEMVEFLISTCDADVEQRGCWSMDLATEMVSPLWCAAARGQTPIIECLIRHGGQVNAISSSLGMTPVQKACKDAEFGIACSKWNSKLDVVECLVKYGADIHRADAFGRTCLMNSVMNVKLCKFLLENGAAIDARDRGNKTALHHAIELHKLNTVKLLLDFKADPNQRSHDDDDALKTACLARSQQIFDYLVEHGSYSPGRLADANELMGSCCFRDSQTARKYWRKAIEIRNSNMVDGNPLAKTPSMPKRDCYRNSSEFTTLDELNAMDWDALNIQNLLIHERILGEHYRTFKALKRTGASYAENLRFEYFPDSWRYCFDFWRRALEISAANDSIFWSNVSDVAQGLVRAMIHSHEQTLEVADRSRDDEEQPRFADVVAIFKLLTSRLVTAWPLHLKQSLWYSRIEDHYNGILKSTTYLIYLLVKMARTSEDEAELRALVRHLVNQNPRVTFNEDTLLHLCMSCENNEIESSCFSIDDEQLMNNFPDLEVTKLLLECEADVNARNVVGETPLYIASCYLNFSNPHVQLLLDHGAHLDTPERSGATPAVEISAKFENTVKLMKYMTLRCLAAQAIVKYEIQCNDLPASLIKFIDLHRLYEPEQQY